MTFVVDGTRCSGWWYPAADGGDDADASSDDRRRPCVVMAHGLAAVKEMRLDAYAERFAAAGMFVFVFDYRGFGSSEGEPRQLLDIDAQHADWSGTTTTTDGGATRKTCGTSSKQRRSMRSNG